ncbi:hypothetical protein bAD24_p00780 (plasmid) [Burkholderia sp. AD24]|nr:hypothetical protein bAD24_p00780 [Burkholderia sp. AD24]
MIESTIRPRKSRYVVRDAAGRVLSETDNRFFACWAWLRNRRNGAQAHDRLSCIEDERSRLRAGDMKAAVRIEKLSATQLARKYNVSTASVQKKLIELGYIEVRSGLHFFTEVGREVGGEYRKNHADASDADGHMVWPFDGPLVAAIQSINK